MLDILHDHDKSNSEGVQNFQYDQEKLGNKTMRANLPLDLFLRYYFLQRKKEFSAEERAFIV